MVWERGGELVSPPAVPRPTGSCSSTFILDIESYPAPAAGSRVTLYDNVLDLPADECSLLKVDAQAWDSKSGESLGRVEKYGQAVTDINGDPFCLAPSINLDLELPELAARKDQGVRLALAGLSLDDPEATTGQWRTIAVASVEATDTSLRTTLETLRGTADTLGESIDAGTVASNAAALWDLKGSYNAALRCRITSLQAAELELGKTSLITLGAKEASLETAIGGMNGLSTELCGADGSPAGLQQAMYDVSVGMTDIHQNIASEYDYINGRGDNDWLAAQAIGQAIQQALGALVANCGLAASNIEAFLYDGSLPGRATSIGQVMAAECDSADARDLSAIAGRLGVGLPTGQRDPTAARDAFQACIARESKQSVCSGDPRAAGEGDQAAPPTEEETAPNTTCGFFNGLWGCVQTKDGMSSVTQCSNESTGAGCTNVERGQVLDQGTRAQKSEVTQQVQAQKANQDPQGKPIQNPAALDAQPKEPTTPAGPGRTDADSGYDAAVFLTITAAALYWLPPAAAAVGATASVCGADTAKCGRAVDRWGQIFLDNQPPMYCSPDAEINPDQSSWYVVGLGRSARPMVEDDRIGHCLCDMLEAAYANGTGAAGGIASTLCPDPQQQRMQRCLDTPQGPDDGPDPECMLLAKSHEGPVDPDVMRGRTCEQIQCGADEIQITYNGKCSCSTLPQVTETSIPCRNGEVSLCWDTDNGVECGCTPYEVPNGGLGCQIDTTRPLTKGELILPDWDAAYTSRLDELTNVLRVRASTEITTRAIDPRQFEVRGDQLRTQLALFEAPATLDPNQVFVQAYYTNLAPVDLSGNLSRPAPINNLYLGQCDLSGASVGELTSCDFPLGSISDWSEADNSRKADLNLAELDGPFAITYEVFTPSDYASRVGLGPISYAGNTLSELPGGILPRCPTSPVGPDPGPISWRPVLNPTNVLLDEGLWQTVSPDVRIEVPRTIFTPIELEPLTLETLAFEIRP